MRHLVAITGPIGSGKSTVAELLARRLWAAGMTVALADLDDLAFAQRAELDLAEFWRRAGVAHSGLVRGWASSTGQRDAAEV
ncbi:adenylyl-sulfate kinase [Iamia sp.]|uniref:adenylyl-sulfate kinase n=1 Tax=Iamia sp. TaxID=2722710 RepID=UPI0032C23F0C